MPENAVWSVRAFKKGQENWFSVESNILYVDFMEGWSWTFRNINYLGDEIVGEYGANGSVVRVDTGSGTKDYYYIGTSHGHEIVKSFSILADGKHQQYMPGNIFHGNRILVRKESNLGPLNHKMEITFPPSGDCIIEKHSYKVTEDLNKRFTYLFAFMHCNNTALDQWLAILDEGKDLEGKLPNKGDGRVYLESDVKSLILYSRAMKKGAAYVYPELYKGAGKIKSEIYRSTTGTTDLFSNSIIDRKDDNKLYFRPYIKKTGYKIGDTFGYSIKVIPFSAEQAEWKDKGKRLAVFEEIE